MNIRIRIERGRSQNGFGYYAKVHIPTNNPSFNPFIVPEVKPYNLDSFPLERLLEFVLEDPSTNLSEGFVFYDGLILESESREVLQIAIQKIVEKIKVYYKNFVERNDFRDECEKLWEAYEDEIVRLEYRNKQL